jgi:CPA2 family monovalent cation:H+ antiporter-2
LSSAGGIRSPDSSGLRAWTDSGDTPDPSPAGQPMPHHTSLIAMLVFGFVLAFVLGALANRLRLSPLVGYLLAGVLAGPFTPGFVGDQAIAQQLAEIGVILLMFGVGLHFSLRDLMSVKNIAIPGAVAQIAVATALGWGLSELMGWSHVQGLVFGFSLATASTVVLLRAMEERRLLDTRRGKIAVGWLIVEDLACVLALVLIPALAGVLDGSAGESAGSLWMELAITLGKVVAFVVFMLVVGRRAIPWILERIAGTGSRELFTLAVLAIAMGVAFGSAELFGVSFALGAFFAGMLLNESEFSHQAAQDSLPMRDAFAVLFFVSVGMLFDPNILVQHPWQVLATTLIIVFGKSAAAYVIVRAFGHPNSTALTISTSLAQIGEFAFIIAGLGLTLGILPQDGHSLVLAGALISIMLNPILFMALDRWQAREDARVLRDAPAEPAVVPMDIGDHAIIVGYGRVGGQLAHLLHERGVPLVVIEDDTGLVEQARADGLPAIRGNAANKRVMLEAAPERAKLAVFAIPQALEAGETIARLKALNPAITVLARAHSEGQVRHLLEHGADAAVLAERELAYSLAEMVMATPPYRPARA